MEAMWSDAGRAIISLDHEEYQEMRRACKTRAGLISNPAMQRVCQVFEEYLEPRNPHRNRIIKDQA